MITYFKLASNAYAAYSHAAGELPRKITPDPFVVTEDSDPYLVRVEQNTRDGALNETRHYKYPRGIGKSITQRLMTNEAFRTELEKHRLSFSGSSTGRWLSASLGGTQLPKKPLTEKEARFAEAYGGIVHDSIIFDDILNQPEESKTMKPALLMALLRTDFVTVRVRFNNNNSDQREYIYKVKKHYDLKPGDPVIVLSPSAGLTVARVVSVDQTPQLNDCHDYKWIVQKVDTTDYDANMASEQAFAEAMDLVESTRRREEALTAYRASLPDGSEARAQFELLIKALELPKAEAVTTA